MRWMVWRAMGIADIARHVIGCQVTEEARANNAWMTLVSSVRQALGTDLAMLRCPFSSKKSNGDTNEFGGGSAG